MMWANPAEFFAMGGYGLYVWGAYAVCLVVLLAEPWITRRQRREALIAASRTQEESA